MSQPTEISLASAAQEFNRIGQAKFLKKYFAGPPRRHYIAIGGSLIPLKALWAAAHQPPIQARQFKTGVARRGFRKFGIVSVVEADIAEQYSEGRRMLAETKRVARSSQIAQQAKKYYGLSCKACGFNFESFYGATGKGYIECHHIDPLSGRAGLSKLTRIEDLTVVCANCHRMIHRSRKALTIDELKDMIKAA